MRLGNASRQRWIILVLVMAATFSPSVLAWMLDPSGSWYRPFIVWFVIIMLALAIQLKSWRHDDV